MLRIGYVRLTEPDHQEAVAELRARGCHVVRIEEDGDAGDAQPVLGSILDFIGEGDELVAVRLEHLSRSPRFLLQIIHRLDQRRATMSTMAPPVTTAGAEGETFRAILAALADYDPAETPRRRTRAPAEEILALQRAGLGPVEIARRLGVSRMTVWRKLRMVEACATGG